MSDRPTRDCTCKRANHQHGTAAAYRTDGCRCAPCSAAQTEEVRAYRLQQITGRNNYRAEATRVRDHVAVLRDTWGLSPNAIATTAGVSYQTIYRLDTAERITRRAGAALLRVSLDDLPDDALVNARGVHRRVQALATLGWAPRWIASQIHYGNPTHILTVSRCRLGTHRAVAALYEDLWDQPRPVESLDDMRARQRVMNRATREGWAPPAAWDDIDLDEAPAVVEHTTGVDVEDVRQLHAANANTYEMCDRLNADWPRIVRAVECADEPVLLRAVQERRAADVEAKRQRTIAANTRKAAA